MFDRIDAVLAEILKEISLADLQNMRTITTNGNTCSLFKNSFKRNDKLKKIAIFQTDLLVGGIQKSLLNFLNRFGGKDYLIDVYLFNEEKFYDVAKLPENIRFIYLKPFNYFNRLVYFDILRRFKKYDIKEQYDIAIDFNSYSNECAIGALCKGQ